MDIAAWLRDLELERYEPAFRDNDIDAEVLPRLTAEDLVALGVTSVGHRRKLLDGILALRRGSPAPNEPSAGTEPEPVPAAGIGPRASGAERRQLTVMFVDLVGSTALSERLDPEEMSEVMRAYQSAVASEVTRFDGHVAKYMGDGVLAYFGYPQAREDAAERAVRAGLGILDAVRGLKPQHDVTLRVRTGIATGLVVVGDVIGEGAAREEAVVGETPNLAARLQALAAPDTVVIGPSTWRLVGGLFECVDLGEHHLKGFAQPVRAWRVLGPGAAESRFEARQQAAAGMTPLVGRGRELALLLECWERASRAGEGQVALLAGEPGIGKSRLLQALRERLAAEPHTRLNHYCSPYHVTSPLHPVIGHLERAAGFARDDDAGAKLAKLEALARRAGNEIAEVAPLLAALLSLPTEGRYPPLDLTPQERKARTLEALLAQLVGLAAERPVLLVLEDAHWLDPTTRELFDLTVERVRDLPVLAVITHRPEFQPPWVGHAHVTALTLDRLSRRQGAVLVERVTGGKALPAEAVAQIVAKTDGVPLFVEELTKAVLESGLVEEEGGRYALAGPLPPLAIPSTLQDSLLARLDRLAPAKEVAQIGAALGREFSYELLAAVAPLREGELREALNQLCASELVFCRGEPPAARYSFKHALVQDAAYGTLLKSRRQQLHVRIVRALEERFPETVETEPELLAHHCTEAGAVERAIEYWHRAGQRALARAAVKEALAHLGRGLADLPAVADAARRADLELDLQISLASASIAAEGYGAEATERAYDRARRLAEGRIGDPRRFAILHGLFVVRWNHAALGEALGIAREMLHEAERADYVAGRCVAHRTIAVALNPAAEFASALEHARRAVELYDPEAHADSACRYGHDIGVGGLMHVAIAAWHLGRIEESDASVARAEAIARGLRHANTIGYWYLWATYIRVLANDHEAARRLATEMVEFGDERVMNFWSAIGRSLLGCAHAIGGDAPAAIAVLDDGMARLKGLRISILDPMFTGCRATAAALGGDAAGARELFARALDVIARTGERWFEPEILRLQAGALEAAGASATAEEALGRAVDAARRQGNRWYELRAAAGLARLRARQGRREEAHALLAPIYGRFGEGFDTPDLRDAGSLLGGLR